MIQMKAEVNPFFSVTKTFLLPALSKMTARHHGWKTMHHPQSMWVRRESKYCI